MVKKLSRIGNSLGVILDRPVLELLQIDENTPLEITTDGEVLMLRPVRGEKKDRVRASAAKMVKAHAKTLAKLAEMIAPEFLDLEEVLEIHALQLDEFGGIAGVRAAAEGRADKQQIADQLRKLVDEPNPSGQASP